jgi:outer membrane beta-barrel protein
MGMDMNWLRTVLPLLLAALLPGAAALAQAPAPSGEREQPIEPTVARHGIEVPRIHANDFELGAFLGSLNLDGFGSELVYGLRLAYHLSEDFFLEGSYGRSTISDERYRRFGLALFPAQEEDVDYYQVSVGYNVLPGEVFAGRRHAFTSALFLSTGLGNVSFADEDHFTYNVGVGLRVLPTDQLSVRLDMRGYIFETDILGESELTFNSELTAGLGYYF